MPLDPLGIWGKPTESEPIKEPDTIDPVKEDPLALFSASGVGEARKPTEKQTAVDKLKADPMTDVADAAIGDPLEIFAPAETAMSLSSSALLWPFSKVFGAPAVMVGGKEEGEAIENMVMDLAYKPYTKPAIRAVDTAGKIIETALFPARKVGEAFEEFTPHIKGDIKRGAAERLGWLMETGVEAIEFKLLGDVPKLARQKAANIKMAKDMGFSNAEIARDILTRDDLGYAADLAMAKQRKIVAETVKKESPLQLNKTGEVPHQIQGGETVLRQEYEFVQGDKSMGKGTVDIRGDTAGIEWIESEGLNTKQTLELMKEYARQNPSVNRMIGRRTKGGKNYDMELDLNRIRRKATSANAAARKIRKARNHGLSPKELLRNRQSHIIEHQLDSEIFIQSIEKRHSRSKLEAMPFIIEKLYDPSMLRELVAKDIISKETAQIIADPSWDLMKDVNLVRNYYKEGHKFLKNHWQSVGWRENYVTHLWDLPWREKNYLKKVGNAFVRKNPFLEESSNPTLIDGIKKGLRPKTTNIADLLRVYDSYKIKTAYNSKFVEGLKKMKTPEGKPMLIRRKDFKDGVHDGWTEFDHPTLNRGVYYGALDIKPIGQKAPMIKFEPVLVHPDLAPVVRNIFGSRNLPGGKVLHAVEMGNAVTKKAMLSLSLFHHLALTEAALGTGIGKQALKMWSPKKIYNALMKGENPALTLLLDVTKDGVRHGLTVDPLPDYEIGKINRLMDSLEAHAKRVGKKTGKVGTAIKKTNQVWDAALWQYYHTNLKVMAYEATVAKEFARAADAGVQWTPEYSKATKQKIAEFVNDSFGGQNWELMTDGATGFLGDPKVQRMMQLAWLAPDWTISTIRQASGIASGSVRGKIARRFWARSAAYFMTITQALNYYNTRRDYGEGRFTWQNPKGKQWDVYFGHNEDGSERYLRIGKQFREAPEWIMNFWEKGGSKLSPVAREIGRQIFQVDPGSGFETKFKDEEGVSKAWGRVASVAKMGIPFPLRPYIENRPAMFMLSIPTSKGMTKYRSVELFKKALKKGDRKGVKKIYVQALQNGINAEKMLDVAANEVKKRKTYDEREWARDLFKELSLLPSAYEREQLLEKYVESGVLNRRTFKALQWVLQEEMSIEAQQRFLGIPTK